MLDDFSLSQKVACNIIKNSINNNKLSHAYLINTNGFNKGFDFTKALAKTLLCPYNYCDNNRCVDCTQCNMIDNNCFPELFVIEADGIWIKKEQTDKLQSEFSKKSVNTNKKVYIINGVDRLNSSASNSILKFLEEPEEGIIALLMTDNIYNVLDTIISRCQILNLNKLSFKNNNMISNIANSLYNSEEKITDFINDDNSSILVKNVVDFLIYLENNKLDTFLKINEIWNQYFITKDDYIIAFDIVVMFYNDIINFKLNKDILLSDYVSSIESFDYFTINDINTRLKLVFDLKNDLLSNVNLSLIMDKFIIRMEELS